jgi:hypothetical protein
MIPPLPPTRANRLLYQTFITALLARYESRSTRKPSTYPDTPTHSRSSSSKSSATTQGVAQVVPAPHGSYILFLTSTLPVVPCNPSLCHTFVQFSCTAPNSSQASSPPSLASEVYDLAHEIFGNRASWWCTSTSSGDQRTAGLWNRNYVDTMHRAMMSALETGVIEIGGQRKTLLDIEADKEDGEEEVPPPVPPKVEGDGKGTVVVKTHRRVDSGISVTSPISAAAVEKRLPDTPGLADLMVAEEDAEVVVVMEDALAKEGHGHRQRNKLGEWILALRPRKGGGGEGREDYVQMWHNS